MARKLGVRYQDITKRQYISLPCAASHDRQFRGQISSTQPLRPDIRPYFVQTSGTCVYTSALNLPSDMTKELLSLHDVFRLSFGNTITTYS